MHKPIIEVENLSKLYHLGLIGSTTLRESVERWWYRAFGKEEALKRIGARRSMISSDDPQAGPEPNTMWALKDISFSVQPGEILGIIGKNGAGKSTLLKVLSRITEPTSGKAVIRGRTSSLLEVGTGFHPELTGRENTYLNGAILGMRKREIDRKFDEIVAFAEVEKFIDTPVKRYSSGMYVRLAFSVAAHLEPEILLVDEVLAVGDAVFQKKCLGKMGEVAKGGRTVLFVSHNMAAIKSLCNSVVLIKSGKQAVSGSPEIVVREYLKHGLFPQTGNLLSAVIKRRGNGLVRFTEISFSDLSGLVICDVVEGQPFIIHVSLRVYAKVKTNVIAITFIDQNGQDILTTIHYDSLDIKELGEGYYCFDVVIDPNPFIRESIGLRLACFGPNYFEYDHIYFAYSFNVFRNQNSKDILFQRPGVINIPCKWIMRKFDGQ